MEVTIHLPGIGGISDEQIAEFWAGLLDEMPHTLEFWPDGNYTMTVDETHQDSVHFFVDNDCIQNWAKCEY